MRLKTISYKSMFSWFSLYLIANVFLLLNFQGIYWDDWTLVNQEPEALIEPFAQAGYISTGYFHLFLQSIGNGVYVYRLLTFAAYFFSGVCLYYILKKINIFDKQASFFIVVLFLLAPVNEARIAVINVPSIFLLFIFYFAFFLLSLYLNDERRLHNRLIALVLFFCSFVVESLLVFYFSVLAYIFYVAYQNNQTLPLPQLIKNFLLRYIDFIALPLIFFVVKHTYFVPYGDQVGYNALSFNFISIAFKVVKAFWTSLCVPIGLALTTAVSYFYITIPVVIICAYLLRDKYAYLTASRKSILLLFSIGVALFVLAIFPYCAVGKLPMPGAWESRHQLLVPLGMAFIIYSLIVSTESIHKKMPIILMYGVIAVFVTRGLCTYYSYNLDWFYQVSLMEKFKASKIIRDNTTFVAKDNLNTWAGNRTFRFYETCGLMKRAFKEDTRLLIYEASLSDVIKSSRPEFNCYHWKAEQPIYLEVSKRTVAPLTWMQQFRLFSDSIFNPESFAEDVQALTTITYLNKPAPEFLKK